MADIEAQDLTPFAHAANHRCFGCGPANAVGLHLEFLKAQDGTIVCHATIGTNYEGPPGYVHGGMIATMLDEAMSKAVRTLGVTAMTRHMEVDYLRPVHSSVPIRIEGRLVRSDGRKHWAEAAVLSENGSKLATASGLFIEVKAR
jgi:uncharacterized protein (TIGR00369 family)